MWVFGYGSLIWRPAIPFVERRPAVLRGYKRRFWQGSVDHRGLPGAPGRVVTLLPEDGAETWGVAYRVHPDQVERVVATLDHREKGGYDKLDVRLAPDGIEATVYVATPDNPQFLGPALGEDIAALIATSIGPSGENREYLVELVRALRRMGVHDPHVEYLVSLLPPR